MGRFDNREKYLEDDFEKKQIEIVKILNEMIRKDTETKKIISKILKEMNKP